MPKNMPRAERPKLRGATVQTCIDLLLVRGYRVNYTRNKGYIRITRESDGASAELGAATSGRAVRLALQMAMLGDAERNWLEMHLNSTTRK